MTAATDAAATGDARGSGRVLSLGEFQLLAWAAEPDYLDPADADVAGEIRDVLQRLLRAGVSRRFAESSRLDVEDGAGTETEGPC